MREWTIVEFKRTAVALTCCGPWRISFLVIVGVGG